MAWERAKDINHSVCYNPENLRQPIIWPHSLAYAQRAHLSDLQKSGVRKFSTFPFGALRRVSLSLTLEVVLVLGLEFPPFPSCLDLQTLCMKDVSWLATSRWTWQDRVSLSGI